MDMLSRCCYLLAPHCMTFVDTTIFIDSIRQCMLSLEYQLAMDVDEPLSEAAPIAPKHIALSPVIINEDDPFDLKSYVEPYNDRRRIERLLFVARSCPALRVQAYKAALNSIKQCSLDYRLFLEVLVECKELDWDESWAEDAKAKQENGLEKLDVELKNYQNNLIKESIRVRSIRRQPHGAVLTNGACGSDGLSRHW